MKKRWIPALFLILCVTVLGLSGCAISQPEGTPVVFTEEEAEQDGNVMIFAANIDGQTDRAYLDNVWMNRSKVLGSLVFQGLFIAEESTDNIRGDICEDYIVSPDGTETVLTIREDIWWQDGIRLTAEDVVWSIHTFLKVPETNGLIGQGLQTIEGTDKWMAGTADSISGIRTEGNNIYIKTLSKYSSLMASLGQLAILPKHCLEDVAVEEFNNCDFWDAPVGSGPYQVVSSNEKEIVFEVYDKYAGVRPQIRQIRYKVLDNPGTDEFDFALTMDPEIISKYRTRPEFTARKTDHLYYRYLFFNLDGRTGENAELLQDQRVRRALMLGLDRQGMVGSLYKSTAEVLSTGIPKSDSWHLDKDASLVGYRPREAKRLLEEAGFDFDKTLVLTRYSTDELSVKLLEQVASDWGALGIKTEIVPVTSDATSKLFVESDWYDVALKNLSAADYDEWYYEYSTENTLWAVVNSRTDFDAMIKDTESAEWAYERERLYEKLQKKEGELVYKIPIALVSQYVIYNNERMSIPEMQFPNLWYYFDLKLEQWKLSDEEETESE